MNVYRLYILDNIRRGRDGLLIEAPTALRAMQVALATLPELHREGVRGLTVGRADVTTSNIVEEVTLLISNYRERGREVNDDQAQEP